MPRNNQSPVAPGDTSLSAKVQAIRDEALNIVRMQNISNLISQKYTTSISIKPIEEEITYLEKQVGISSYKLTKLDEADPEYKTKKESLEAFNKADQERLASAKNRLEEHKTRIANETKAIEEKIAKLESGETKVSHDSVNYIANQMIADSYKS